MLIVSSIDAFCSVIVFDEKELGTVMKLSPENFSNIKKLEEMDVSTPLKDPEDIFTSSSGKLPKQTELGPSR